MQKRIKRLRKRPREALYILQPLNYLYKPWHGVPLNAKIAVRKITCMFWYNIKAKPWFYNAFQLSLKSKYPLVLYISFFLMFLRADVKINTRSGIEVVITGLTRNQFASNRTWVRIPSSPPTEPLKTQCFQGFFLFGENSFVSIFCVSVNFSSRFYALFCPWILELKTAKYRMK